MTVQLIINNQDIAGLLIGPPKITDDLESVCRTLEFSVYAANGLVNFMGQQVQLFVGGVRWFVGILEVRGWEAKGKVTFRVYDPLYFLNKNPDDYYFKGMTATQRAEHVLKSVGVKKGQLASTGVVLPPSLYKIAPGDKVIIDGLIKTARSGGKNYWLRYDPSEKNEGATIFERKVPSELWVFERGVNLTSARYEESLEDHYNVVKLINRETGKTVVKMDTAAIKSFGPRTRFEEVDKTNVATMAADAAALLKEGSKVKTAISLEGLNANLAMPMFFSGDVVYVEEDFTQIIGPYHIKRVEQTVLSSKVVLLTLDVEEAPGIPPIQFEDAEKDATGDGKKSKKKKAKAKSAKDGKDEGKGVSEGYSAEMLAIIEKYGLDGGNK